MTLGHNSRQEQLRWCIELSGRGLAGTHVTAGRAAGSAAAEQPVRGEEQSGVVPVAAGRAHHQSAAQHERDLPDAAKPEPARLPERDTEHAAAQSQPAAPRDCGGAVAEPELQLPEHAEQHQAYQKVRFGSKQCGTVLGSVLTEASLGLFVSFHTTPRTLKKKQKLQGVALREGEEHQPTDHVLHDMARDAAEGRICKLPYTRY